MYPITTHDDHHFPFLKDYKKDEPLFDSINPDQGCTTPCKKKQYTNKLNLDENLDQPSIKWHKCSCLLTKMIILIHPC